MGSLPLSGQILGAMLRAIGQGADDLEHELAVSGRQVRTFFAGGRIAAETRGEVVRLVVRKAVLHLAGGPPASSGIRGEIEARIDEVLARWSDVWDRLVTHWRVIQPSGEAGRAAASAALRLVTVDTVVRAAGVTLLAGALPPSEPPRWARWAIDATGAPGLLRDLKARANLSTTEVADMVDYQRLSEGAIKTHLDGTHRPGDEQL